MIFPIKSWPAAPPDSGPTTTTTIAAHGGLFARGDKLIIRSTRVPAEEVIRAFNRAMVARQGGRRAGRLSALAVSLIRRGNKSGEVAYVSRSMTPMQITITTHPPRTAGPIGAFLRALRGPLQRIVHKG